MRAPTRSVPVHVTAAGLLLLAATTPFFAQSPVGVLAMEVTAVPAHVRSVFVDQPASGAAPGEEVWEPYAFARPIDRIIQNDEGAFATREVLPLR